MAKESTTTRFELARAEPIGFQVQLLNHSDTLSLPSFEKLETSTRYERRLWGVGRKKVSTTMRFELTRAEPSRFLIYRLNHSATLSRIVSPQRLNRLSRWTMFHPPLLSPTYAFNPPPPLAKAVFLRVHKRANTTAHKGGHCLVRGCDTELTFCRSASRSSDIVQWLVYLPVTQVTRVRFPVLERFFGAFPVCPPRGSCRCCRR